MFRCELSSSSPGESTRRKETGKEPEAAQGAEAEKNMKKHGFHLAPKQKDVQREEGQSEEFANFLF